MTYEALPQPAPGKLAEAVYRLAGEMIQEISSEDDRINIPQTIEMITTCPIVSAAVEAKVLLGLSQWGKYTNGNEEHQGYVDENFACMNGSFEDSLAETYSLSPIGFSCSEISWQLQGVEPAELRLESMMALDPRKYSFRGRRGAIESIRYTKQTGGHVDIDYMTKILHVVNKPYIAFGDPCGVADCRLASSAWQAWKLIIAEALLSGQRQATPIIAGTSAEEPVPLTDSKGNPILDRQGQPIFGPPTKAMAQALEGLTDNGSYISIPFGAKVQALNAATDGKFFLALLEYFQKLMLLAFMVPETLFSVGQGGLGNGGISESHQKIMMRQLSAITKQVKARMREKVVRPMIEWRFGPQEDYGDWAEPEVEESDRIALFNAITTAIQSGVMPAADLDVINKHRNLAGISPLQQIVDRITPQPTAIAA